MTNLELAAELSHPAALEGRVYVQISGRVIPADRIYRTRALDDNGSPSVVIVGTP